MWKYASAASAFTAHHRLYRHHNCPWSSSASPETNDKIDLSFDLWVPARTDRISKQPYSSAEPSKTLINGLKTWDWMKKETN